jgi:hypothetical protein
VWVHVLDGDSRSAAETQAKLLQMQGVMHQWDGNGEVGPSFTKSLALTGPAWDLYLLHGSGVRWEGKLPPSPTFWMHQLSPQVGADPAFYLGRNPDLLGQALHDLLKP